MVSGIVTQRGPAVVHRGAVVPLPATGQALAEWAAGLNLCPECGGQTCDCVTPEEMAALLTRLDADPHGVNDLDGIEIPF